MAKMQEMALRRHIVDLASAALIAAAMLLTPAIAEAHIGQDHGAAGPNSISASQHRSGKAQAAPASRVEAVSAHQSASPPTHKPSSGEDSGGCSGGCCGSGLGCCGAVLFAPQPELPSIVFHVAIIPSSSNFGAGIDPDALRRPPRSFA